MLLYQLVNPFEQRTHRQVFRNQNIWFIKKINAVFVICLKCNFKNENEIILETRSRAFL